MTNCQVDDSSLDRCSVRFNHIGLTNHRGLQQMRNNAGFTMSGFMFLLGFSLTSSVPDGGIPLSELREFWVSRFGPPHAIFVFQMTVSFILWNMRCRPSVHPGCRTLRYNVLEYLEGAFTSRGELHDQTGGILWFNTKMYWFILLFPAIDFVVRRWLLKPQFRRAALVFCVCGAAVVSPVVTYFDSVLTPYLTRSWTFALGSGVFAWHVFRWAGPRSLRRLRLWGIVTDLATLALLGVFVAAYFDRCVHTPRKGEPFAYTCSQEPYKEWIFRYHQLKSLSYWCGRNMAWLSIFRLISPVLFLWLYGLSVGEGHVARLLSRPLFSKLMGPLAYDVYTLQLPAFWIWWYCTRGLQWQSVFAAGLPFPVQAPLPMGEAFCLWVLTYCFSWLYDRYIGVILVPATLRVVNLIAGVAFWPLTASGLCAPTEGRREEEEAGTLAEVQRLVRRLTGVTHGPDARLEDLNLDSFGTMALIGTLKASKPHVSGLRPGSLLELGTVGGLAAFVDAQDPVACARKKAA